MRSLGLGGNKNKTAAGGAARTTAQLSIAALVLGFVFLSWCVLVGGLSAVQHKAPARNSFEFEWWIVFFELFLVILAAIELAGFRRGHSGFVALKAVNTALIMYYCQNWNDARRGTTYAGYGVKAVRATFAGFVLLAISNSLLILTMGTEPPVRDNYQKTGSTGQGGVQSTRSLNNQPLASTAVEGGNGQTVV